ncbi:MAG: hypothetical protein CMM02_07540, partial [Rhodopirellula sp.]|nr:hypothetical protein [Rhodopirellula sp.]
MTSTVNKAIYTEWKKGIEASIVYLYETQSDLVNQYVNCHKKKIIDTEDYCTTLHANLSAVEASEQIIKDAIHIYKVYYSRKRPPEVIREWESEMRFQTAMTVEMLAQV